MDKPRGGDNSPLVPRRSKPRKPGKLVGPTKLTGNNICIAFSGVDENFPWAGADPEDGESFASQLLRGPFSWSMFVSCVGFLLPASIHIYKHEHWMDWFAGIALISVSVTSPLCDAFCVWSAVYEDPGKTGGYERTALAIGQPEQYVKKMVQDSGADPQILATDYWNNFTRMLDRLTCGFVVAPAVGLYAWLQRPTVPSFLILLSGFGIAWAACGMGQIYRMVSPCGVKRTGKSCTMEKSYQKFLICHEAWHFLLILLFTASALYRPEYK